MVAITFRVVPRAGKEVGSERRSENVTFGLPERVFYCFPEEDLGGLLQAHGLGPSTNPGKSEAAQIKRWIHNCDNNHERCLARMRARQKAKKLEHDVFVPTCLLEIGEKKSKKNIRVVETEPNNIKASYATFGTLGDRQTHMTPKTKEGPVNTEYHERVHDCRNWMGETLQKL